MAKTQEGTTTKLVNFAFERETKGAVRYQEVDENGAERMALGTHVIGTLYLRKSAFNGGQAPKVLQVSLAWK